MLDDRGLRDRLPIGWIGVDFYYHESIGSTNAEAIQLAESGAPHGTLVLADAQTAGKGRAGRRWITNPGTALAFSLILRPSNLGIDQWLILFGLGALSVAEALSEIGLQPEIKWPNDVLIDGKKVAGILVNSNWTGESVNYSVLGIGLNVSPEAIPDDAELDFPATSIGEALGRSINRTDLLIAILKKLKVLFQQVNSSDLSNAWQDRLAYLNQEVVVKKADGTVTGRLIGLTANGELKLIEKSGNETVIGYGDVSLRPIEGGEKRKHISSQ
ncbi:MAG: biotin--[acetyl-CoA-carboxylase] ligase [Anaerolineales bacterium]|nr:biotin--[acetyl-CoA-carboxylase] ligase [Anaerolineales bacterium]